jgi:hypothetical protein
MGYRIGQKNLNKYIIYIRNKRDKRCQLRSTRVEKETIIYIKVKLSLE